MIKYNIIILGAGRESYKRVLQIPENWNIVAFLDNDKNKQGLKWGMGNNLFTGYFG